MTTANGTERLEIRVMQQEDAEPARLLHNNDEMLMWLTDTTHVSQAQQADWYQSISKSQKSRRYALRRRSDNAFVGLFRVDAIDPVNRNCLVGCDVMPEMRKQGYATESFRYMLGYLFGFMGIHRVGLVTRADNQAGLALYAKLGFRREGVQRQAIFRCGVYVDLVAMGMLREEFSGS
ncbi:MAG: GNAT family protein [Magnetospirillum sp.]|nr:GNAT family protein [Magnetospirillum sp.]